MNSKPKQYKRSKFSTAAGKRGMDAEEYAAMVLSNPSEYSQATINKAKYSLPKYGIGGDILGGAASGAGAGAVAGPWGAVIGGVAGAVGGLFSGKSREREEAAALAKQRKTDMADSARQGRFAELQSEQDYNYNPVFAYGGYMENPPNGMQTALNETSVTNEGKVLGNEIGGASAVMTPNYQPISRRTYYLENKRAGVIPESVTFEKFNKDFNKYTPSSDEYKVDKKTGKAYKNFPDVQMTEEDIYNYKKLGVRPPMKGRRVAAGNIQTKMALGGDITGIPNVEVEGEESIQMPNGESFMPQGPSHAQGGIPMELPSNTRVFSKKLKVPGTNKKFSEVHDKTSKSIKSYEDIIDNPYETPVAKQTAKKMLAKLRDRQDVLFNTQQALNGNNSDVNNSMQLPRAEGGMDVKGGGTHADLLKFINDSYDERKKNYSTIGNKEPDWENLLEKQRQVTLARANSPEILNNPSSWSKIINTVSYNTGKNTKRELPPVPSFYSADAYSQYQPGVHTPTAGTSNLPSVPGYTNYEYQPYVVGSTYAQPVNGMPQVYDNAPRFNMAVPGYEYDNYSNYMSTGNQLSTQQPLPQTIPGSAPISTNSTSPLPIHSSVAPRYSTEQPVYADPNIVIPAQQQSPQLNAYTQPQTVTQPNTAAMQPVVTQPVSTTVPSTNGQMQPMKSLGTKSINVTATNPKPKADTLATMPDPKIKSGNFGNTVTGIAQALPAVYNIAQGLFGKTDKLDYNDYTNPYEGAALKAMKDRKYNIDPMLEANRTSYSTANRNLATAARTRGELLSGYGANAYGKSLADMQAWATKNNEENRYAGEAASMYANLGQNRAQSRFAVDNYNARARAAKENMLGTGITQVGQLAQNYMLNRNRTEADKMRMGALQQMYSNYTLDPVSGEWRVR